MLATVGKPKRGRFVVRMLRFVARMLDQFVLMLGKVAIKVNDSLASLEDVKSKKSYGKSIRVFGSNDGPSGGVAVSGDQVVFINFDKGNGLVGFGLSPMEDDLEGPAIDLYVDLGDLEPLFRKGKVGEIVASPGPSDRKWGKKEFFPLRIDRMKTRGGARGCNFSGVEEELADRIARGKGDDKG
ncbi:hypothetical protein LWI29_035390 [Acer saccharum]|uniref:Uncharacterized protein n=1 Tax=Acer saccharum TaxID=4024 RepID=A0AA39VH44_ACESA|nr:hypothetical protein LWI29_035390 [Acer saccharum]